MNDDLMRLSDLVPTYARCYKVSTQEAAYALHELIEDLYVEYGVNRCHPNSVNSIFWVGTVRGAKRTLRAYVLYFQLLSKYFYDLFDSPIESDKNLVSCYCEDDQKSKNIPASVVYFSRAALGEWIIDAGVEVPIFLSVGTAGRQAEGNDERREFQTKELNSISLIINGLISLIKEVDKAHCDQSTNYADQRRADKIKGHAARLSNPPRKNFDLCSALISLADDAEIDIPKDRKTLRKYMLGQSESYSED